MSPDPVTPDPTLQRPRVLIIEDDKVAADHLKNELEDRGCECTLLIHKHGYEFEADLERMYPPGYPVRPECIFHGAILDVIFKVSGTTLETEGGRDLYLYLRTGNNPCILDQLGIILVVSQHHNPRGAFKEIQAFENPKLRFAVKNHSGLLGPKLDEFVNDLKASM